MLSRIGNSLFWLGRYLERAEHLARYTKVHYVSSLDAPLVHNRELVLESILQMNGVGPRYHQQHAQLTDDDVLYFVTLDERNPFSIVSSIGYIRENARGTRDTISIELWEAINRFYHSMNNYDAAQFHKEGIHSFSQKIEENSAVIKGYIDNTLMRNEVWMLISLGIHLERAMQVTRILHTKVTDVEKLKMDVVSQSWEFFHWSLLLKSAESFDMHNRHYKCNPSRPDSMEFLIFNPIFPKSITYNLNIVQKLISTIAFKDQKEKGSIIFLARKIATQYQHLTIEEVEKNIKDFLVNTLNNINSISQLLEEKYLVF